MKRSWTRIARDAQAGIWGQDKPTTRSKWELSKSTSNPNICKNSGCACFGSVTVWAWNGSGGSRFRFWRFPFSVLAVPLGKGRVSVFPCSCSEAQFNRQGRFLFRFRFLKTVAEAPGPPSVTGRTVLRFFRFHPEELTLETNVRNEKAVQRGTFWAGDPAHVSGVIRVDVPGRKLQAGPRNLGKNKHLSADINDPNA